MIEVSCDVENLDKSDLTIEVQSNSYGLARITLVIRKEPEIGTDLDRTITGYIDVDGRDLIKAVQNCLNT